MDCVRIREACSATLDGEPTDVPVEVITRHLRGCAECRAFVDRARHWSAAFAPAAAPRDLAARILAAAGADRHDTALRTSLLRIGLVAIACAQIALGLPDLLYSGAHEKMHVAHEVGAFDIALAFGFLFAATRPLRAVGLLPFAGALAAGLIVTGIADLVGGHTVALTETLHLLELAGALMLWLLARPPARPAQHAELHLV